MASKNIQNIIRNIFDPNLTQNISAQDFQIFVDAIFESTESIIRKFESIEDVEQFRLSSAPEAKIFIQKGDIVIITKTNPGIYLAKVDKPAKADLEMINDISVLVEGKPGNVLHQSVDGPFWADIRDGYFIKGKLSKTEILNLLHESVGTIYIESSTGDGYSWDGNIWSNIGSLVGPKGEVSTLEIATSTEVNEGFENTKAITSLALNNSNVLRRKENSLGLPSKDDQVLRSTKLGARYWKDSIDSIAALEDTKVKTPSTGDGLLFVDGAWVNSPVIPNVERSERPRNPYPGQMIFDETLSLPLWFNSKISSWINAFGEIK